MLKFSLPENILQPLFSASNSSTLDETLELLIEASKTPGGRLDLGSKNILPVVLQLSQSLSYPSEWSQSSFNYFVELCRA